MGRHRRSAAGRAATSRATGVTDTHGPLTESYGPENLYGYAAIADLPGNAAARSHRKRKAATPVRTGLLGVSAAVALGTVAVAAGVVPGAENYALGGGGNNSDQVQAVGSPSGQETQQGGTSGSADSRDDQSTSRDSDRASSPSAPPSTSAAAAPTATPSQEPATTKPGKTAEPAEPSAPVSEVARPKAPVTTAPVTSEAAAEAEVLKLVNEERAKAGCTPVTGNSALTDLAQSFSDDMALRDFFDHTDPSGLSPWDRAAKAGITALGGENIARGQADAAAVMDAWMNSEGHRANILNCDFKTLGVGAHFGAGGPWWTQDFGY
ncbi:CAP domain-containing protein [Streptomyces sp. NBC_01571]|uniref:CAP domain-containing protein n=1 Tax=Streptomyces sp. NBC_01571 TaxID=2975883 RepID=UPI002255EDCA|nr:CAP domain-containing protein [Streptomyces sp. NBC_01571]MCX4577765.1 CAP domain-containing protein [Streptomyces sp. NBC_01571]